MKLCDYGCGQEATHQFKSGKWCCSKHFMLCPVAKNNAVNKMKGINKSKSPIYLNVEELGWKVVRYFPVDDIKQVPSIEQIKKDINNLL